MSSAAGPPPGPLPAAWHDRLASRCEADGFLRFDRFMDLALYDPELGYYARASAPFGRAGDFYTAPSVTPVFARALADRLRAEWERLGRPSPFHVIELGAGDGTLAAEMIPWLAATLPAGSDWRYTPRERTVPARVRLADRLGPLARGPLRLEDAPPADPVPGAFVANELLDALPLRRWRFTGGEWREEGARLAAGRLAEGWRSPDPLPTGVAPPPDPVEGDWFEFSEETGGLLRGIADHLSAGLVVLLDYGTPEPAPPGHRAGTLAAVRAHRSGEDPFRAPGQEDLSAFVDFSLVRSAARRAGLVERAFRRQREALGAWGYPARDLEWRNETPDATESVRRALASKQLLFGFEGFYALELAARDPPEPASGTGS